MKLLRILVACLLILSASLAMAGREGKEKAGTEDINIGVGELQEQQQPAGNPADLKNSEDKEKAGLLLPAVQSRAGGGTKKKGKVETEFKVEKGEK